MVLKLLVHLNEPDNVNILTFDEADRVEQQQQQQQSPTPSAPATWRPGSFLFLKLNLS